VDKFLTQEFIQRKFAEYYRQYSDSIPPPTSVEKREFAFLLFPEKRMLRHKGFKNVEVFTNFLQSTSPSDVYYSCAYYENPEEEMSAKGWWGADLIFDIDADHIPTLCNKQHDIWKCKNCGMSGSGTKPVECPKCKNQKFDIRSWLCEICLETAKRETIKLFEALETDFGFSSQEIAVSFSGHRGYHVHVEKEAVRNLDSMSRKEIVDYLMGVGLEPQFQGFDLKKAVGPRLADFGWRGRIAKGTYELLILSQEQLEKEGLQKISKDVVQQREQILERWKGKGPWGLVIGVGIDSWEKIIQQAIERQSVKIDTVVTTDIHRLIRLTNTLHGETGLKKIEIPISDIERFDPFKSAVAFKHGSVVVNVSEAPEFRVGDNFYGPYKNQKVELPTATAMLLLCKGVAKIEEDTAHVQ